MASALTVEHYTTECFVKCAQVILSARLPPKPNALPDKRSSRWFLLEVGEPEGSCPEVDLWRKDSTQPMVIEFFSHARGGLRVGGSGSAARVLLERWVIQYVRNMPPATSGSSSNSSSMMGTSPGGGGGRCALDEASVYKRLTLLVRSLHSTTRALPAHRLARSGAPGAPALGYRVSSILPLGHQQDSVGGSSATGAGGASFESFVFAGVQTANGTFQVAVSYAPAATVRLLIEPSMATAAAALRGAAAADIGLDGRRPLSIISDYAAVVRTAAAAAPAATVAATVEALSGSQPQPQAIEASLPAAAAAAAAAAPVPTSSSPHSAPVAAAAVVRQPWGSREAKVAWAAVGMLGTSPGGGSAQLAAQQLLPSARSADSGSVGPSLACSQFPNGAAVAAIKAPVPPLLSTTAPDGGLGIPTALHAQHQQQQQQQMAEARASGEIDGRQAAGSRSSPKKAFSATAPVSDSFMWHPLADDEASDGDGDDEDEDDQEEAAGAGPSASQVLDRPISTSGRSPQLVAAFPPLLPPSSAAAVAAGFARAASQPLSIPGNASRAKARSVADLQDAAAAGGGGAGGLTIGFGAGGGGGAGAAFADGDGGLRFGDGTEDFGADGKQRDGGSSDAHVRHAPSSAPAAPRGMLGMLLERQREAALLSRVPAGSGGDLLSGAAAIGVLSRADSQNELNGGTKGAASHHQQGAPAAPEAVPTPDAAPPSPVIATASAPSAAAAAASSAANAVAIYRGGFTGYGHQAQAQLQHQRSLGCRQSDSSSSVSLGSNVISSSPSLPFACTPSGQSFASYAEHHHAFAAMQQALRPSPPQAGGALPVPTPPGSITARDISALATIRRPSWSSTSGSLQQSAELLQAIAAASGGTNSQRLLLLGGSGGGAAGSPGAGSSYASHLLLRQASNVSAGGSATGSYPHHTYHTHPAFSVSPLNDLLDSCVLSGSTPKHAGQLLSRASPPSPQDAALVPHSRRLYPALPAANTPTLDAEQQQQRQQSHGLIARSVLVRTSSAGGGAGGSESAGSGGSQAGGVSGGGMLLAGSSSLALGIVGLEDESELMPFALEPESPQAPSSAGLLGTSPQPAGAAVTASSGRSGGAPHLKTSSSVQGGAAPALAPSVVTAAATTYGERDCAVGAFIRMLQDVPQWSLVRPLLYVDHDECSAAGSSEADTAGPLLPPLSPPPPCSADDLLLGRLPRLTLAQAQAQLAVATQQVQDMLVAWDTQVQQSQPQTEPQPQQQQLP